MIRLIQSVIERVKALFTLDAMLDLEQQFATRQAERRAELMRAADRYQKEGLTAIADDLRRQANELSEQRPLQTVVPFLGSEPDVDRVLASLSAPAKVTSPAPINRIASPHSQPIANGSRKKGK